MNRKGFTIAELLVVLIIATIMLLATVQVLVTNQRTYTVQQAQINAQQSVRTALDVLFNELREVSAVGGDLLQMGPDTLQVRVQRHFGVVCSVTYSPAQLLVRQIGPWFENTDSIVVFADMDVDRTSDDTWHYSKVDAVDTTATCSGGDPAQVLQVGGMGSKLISDTVRVGAPVRSYETYLFTTGANGGSTYLVRQKPLQSAEILVGPLQSTNGLAFEYLDELGAVTTTATDVAQIRVTLRTDTGVTGPDGGLVGDSITALVHLRN